VGGAGGSAMGGGIYNGGEATLTNNAGLVLSFTAAYGNRGGNGGAGGAALSFQGGTAGSAGGNGGAGGESRGGDAGYGGLGGEAFGGGLDNAVTGTVTFAPPKHSHKPDFTTITGNFGSPFPDVDGTIQP
jgi:hypothetical protein